MKDLKQHILNVSPPRIYSNYPMPDLKSLGVHLLAKVIPAMDKNGDVAFAWFWRMNQMGVYNQQEYDTETTMYQKEHKMLKDNGDTTWCYEFKKGDKKRRCVMTTEIWYKKDEEHRTSPIALLLNQYFAAGLHIVKCRFEDVE